MEKFEVIINGVKPEIREMVVSSMQIYYDQLQELLAPAMAISVTDVNDIAGMKLASEYGKKFVKIRTNTEKKRKEIKSDYLITGKVIDQVAKSIHDEIEKAEAHLKLQATYAERIESERLDLIEAERTKELKKYVEFTDMYNLREMNKTVWDTTISGAKLQYEATEAKRIEAERLYIEAEAAAKAKKNEEEKDRLLLVEENKRLQKQAELRNKLQQLEREEYNRKINEAKVMARLDYEKYKSTATIRTKCNNPLVLADFANEKELLSAWIDRFEMPEMETDTLSLASQEKIKTIHSKIKGFKVWAKNQL